MDKDRTSIGLYIEDRTLVLQIRIELLYLFPLYISGIDPLIYLS